MSRQKGRSHTEKELEQFRAANRRALDSCNDRDTLQVLETCFNPRVSLAEKAKVAIGHPMFSLQTASAQREIRSNHAGPLMRFARRILSALALKYELQGVARTADPAVCWERIAELDALID